MNIQAAIESFREAAVCPGLWSESLECLATALNCDGATLVLQPTTKLTLALSRNLLPFAPAYLSNDIPDPRERRVNPRTDQGFMPDFAYFSAQEIAWDPYYQEFLRPRGFGWHAAAALNRDLVISLKRNANRGPIEGADLSSLDAALPWLRAASRTATLSWRSEFSGELRSFERQGRGAILLDGRGRVIEFNGCVKFGDGLDVLEGALVATHDDRRRLQRFVASILSSSDANCAPGPSMVLLPRPSGARPWILDGMGCTDSLRSLHSQAAAMVLVTDLERTTLADAQRLADVFGLSKTEAKLASQLAAGQCLQKAAVAIGISEGHARQRLKSIFRKTGTFRQHELAVLLGRLN